MCYVLWCLKMTPGVRHKKIDNATIVTYNIFQGIMTEVTPVFVAVNLNNIPCINLEEMWMARPPLATIN